MPSNFLNTMLGEIRSGEILSLLDELENACPVISRQGLNLPLAAFLNQCLYPQGSGKRQPLNLDQAFHTPLLESRIGKLPDGDLREFCAELARRSGKALEFYQSCKVYALINKCMPRLPSPAKPSAKSERQNALTTQRRANRR